jgi:hypothetical protein
MSSIEEIPAGADRVAKAFAEPRCSPPCEPAPKP